MAWPYPRIVAHRGGGALAPAGSSRRTAVRGRSALRRPAAGGSPPAAPGRRTWTTKTSSISRAARGCTACRKVLV